METDMANEQIEPEKNIWTTVTPFSKYLALALFVALPFVGGWVGYHYAPEKIVEVEKVVEVEKENPEVGDDPLNEYVDSEYQFSFKTRKDFEFEYDELLNVERVTMRIDVLPDEIWKEFKPEYYIVFYPKSVYPTFEGVIQDLTNRTMAETSITSQQIAPISTAYEEGFKYSVDYLSETTYEFVEGDIRTRKREFSRNYCLFEGENYIYDISCEPEDAPERFRQEFEVITESFNVLPD